MILGGRPARLDDSAKKHGPEIPRCPWCRAFITPDEDDPETCYLCGLDPMPENLDGVVMAGQNIGSESVGLVPEHHPLFDQLAAEIARMSDPLVYP